MGNEPPIPVALGALTGGTAGAGALVAGAAGGAAA
jgi:hypothetical protein